MTLLIIGFWVNFTGLVGAEASGTPMPEELFPQLQEILRASLDQSPQMVLKNIELAHSEAARMTAVSVMLPTLGSGYSYSASEAAPSTNADAKSRSSGLYYSATISQAVYRWGTLKASADAAKIQLSISQRNYAEGYRQLAQLIRTQYLGLVAKKIARINAVAASTRAAKNLALEQANLDSGRIAPSAIIPLQLEMQESALRTDRANEDLALAKRQFARLTGLPELTDESLPDEIPSVPYLHTTTATMAQTFLSQNGEGNPTIQSARDWVKIGQLNYKVAKYRLYPMFSFGASIAQSNSTSADARSVSQVGVLIRSYGLSASWTIFDGGATRAGKLSARASLRYYERLLQNQMDAVFDQVRSQERQLEFAHRAVVLAETRYALAESAVRLAQGEAQQGQASEVAVDSALAAQEIYRLYVAHSRLDFLSRWSEFVSTVDKDPVLQLLPATPTSNVR